MTSVSVWFTGAPSGMCFARTTFEDYGLIVKMWQSTGGLPVPISRHESETWFPRGMPPLQMAHQLIRVYSSLPEDRSECALRDLFVVGNHEAPVGRRFFTENHVTPFLAV